MSTLREVLFTMCDACGLVALQVAVRDSAGSVVGFTRPAGWTPGKTASGRGEADVCPIVDPVHDQIRAVLVARSVAVAPKTVAQAK